MNYQSNSLKRNDKSVRSTLLLFLFSAILLVGVTGCSCVKNYSVNSYQGPIPIEDTKYLDHGQVGTAARQ